MVVESMKNLWSDSHAERIVGIDSLGKEFPWELSNFSRLKSNGGSNGVLMKSFNYVMKNFYVRI